jgi:hypothetical protein
MMDRDQVAVEILLAAISAGHLKSAMEFHGDPKEAIKSLTEGSYQIADAMVALSESSKPKE